MCGVVGFYCEQPNEGHIDLLDKIINQSKIRGLHSFGYTYKDEKLTTVKQHEIKDISFPLANKIIYHNRYSTSGDYKNHDNNQPIHIDDISLVFNGVLDMGTKEEIEQRYEVNMQTDNDGEIVIKKCGKDKHKIQEFITNTKGSFAGLILTDSNALYVIRNPNRPLWRLQHDNAFYFASTRDIFKRVDESLEPVELEPNKLYEY